jgi:hypothetical protein
MKYNHEKSWGNVLVFEQDGSDFVFLKQAVECKTEQVGIVGMQFSEGRCNLLTIGFDQNYLKAAQESWNEVTDEN